MIPLMRNIFAGVDPTNPWHWPYILAILFTPIMMLLCLATIWGPGWFIGALWFVFISEVTPEEVEEARLAASPSSRP